MDWSLVGTATVIISAMLAGMWSVFLYLSKQFKELRTLAYTLNEQLKEMFTNKLEYHERHDDQRFESIRNDLWEIRIHNAAKDGTILPLKRENN